MKLTFVVLNFNTPDRTGEIIEAKGCSVPTHASVTKNFQKGWMNRLGQAKLTKTDASIIAEWEWPGGEKLPEIALYPAVGGVIDQRVENVVKRCEIKEISISPSPNVDATILSLQEQNPDAEIAWESDNKTLIKRPFVADKEAEHVGPLVVAHTTGHPPASSSGDSH